VWLLLLLWGVQSTSLISDDDDEHMKKSIRTNQSLQQEELSCEEEEEVQLDGGPAPPLVLYQGPVFPPQTRSAPQDQDQASLLDLKLQGDVLENRVVEW